MESRNLRKAASAAGAVSVDATRVNVAVEGIDCDRIPGSFTVHLLKDGTTIASRFMLRPSTGDAHPGTVAADRLAHFDFALPIDAVTDGELSVEIEPVDAEERIPAGQVGEPTIAVHLMLGTS